MNVLGSIFRITIQKKIGNTHPLVKIYLNEFQEEKE